MTLFTVGDEMEKARSGEKVNIMSIELGMARKEMLLDSPKISRKEMVRQSKRRQEE